MQNQIDQTILADAKEARVAFLKTMFARLFGRKEHGTAHA